MYQIRAVRVALALPGSFRNKLTLGPPCCVTPSFSCVSFHFLQLLSFTTNTTSIFRDRHLLSFQSSASIKVLCSATRTPLTNHARNRISMVVLTRNTDTPSGCLQKHQRRQTRARISAFVCHWPLRHAPAQCLLVLRKVIRKRHFVENAVTPEACGWTPCSGCLG